MAKVKNNCITCAGSVINGLCSYCGNFYGPVKQHDIDVSHFKSPEGKALAYKAARSGVNNTAERTFLMKQLQVIKEAEERDAFGTKEDPFPEDGPFTQGGKAFLKIVMSMVIVGALFGLKYVLERGHI